MPFVLAVTPGQPSPASPRARLAQVWAAAGMWLCISDGRHRAHRAGLLGMNALAQHYGEVFLAVKWIGAAYLIGSALAPFAATTPPARLPARPTGHHKDALAGLLTTLGSLSNPVLRGVLPTFVDLANITAVDFVLVCVIACSMVFIVPGYTLLAAQAPLPRPPHGAHHEPGLRRGADRHRRHRYQPKLRGGPAGGSFDTQGAPPTTF